MKRLLFDSLMRKKTRWTKGKPLQQGSGLGAPDPEVSVLGQTPIIRYLQGVSLGVVFIAAVRQRCRSLSRVFGISQPDATAAQPALR